MSTALPLEETKRAPGNLIRELVGRDDGGCGPLEVATLFLGLECLADKTLAVFCCTLACNDVL